MFTRMRLLTILVPVLLVASIETLSDTVLDADLPIPLDTVLMSATAAILMWLAVRQIDRLTSELRARNAELQARNATARGLQDVAVSVAAGAQLEPTLEAVVDRAQSILGTDVALLDASLPGEPETHLVRPAALAARFTGGGLPSAGPAAGLDDRLAAAGFAARLVTPIRMGAATVGELAVGRGPERGFGVEDVETLTALAGMAGVALRNHQLRGSLRELAVHAERERIAREMHDGLAQVLAYVSAKSAAADQLLARGSSAEARTQMAELGAAARSTYVDVREAILGLTTPVAAEQGLVAALEQYGTRFADAAKIAVAVAASPDARHADLSAETEAQAFRIVQEALTNVRKHAHASRVEIRVEASNHDLVVEVRDDGRGMGDQAGGASDWPHYGRATMAARAAEVGGRVEWDSSPAGTTVRLAVPLAKARAAGAAAGVAVAGAGPTESGAGTGVAVPASAAPAPASAPASAGASGAGS